MNTTYCEFWNKKLREPGEPMAEGAARTRDEHGRPYCVVLGEPNAPDGIIEVNWGNAYLGVLFVDEKGRVSTAYSFSRLDDRLFLDEAIFWTYPEGARSMSEAEKVERCFFRADGYVRREIDAQGSDTIEVTEYSDVPVDANWDDVPRFGEWDHIARYER